MSPSLDEKCSLCTNVAMHFGSKYDALWRHRFIQREWFAIVLSHELRWLPSQYWNQHFQIKSNNFDIIIIQFECIELNNTSHRYELIQDARMLSPQYMWIEKGKIHKIGKSFISSACRTKSLNVSMRNEKMKCLREHRRMCLWYKWWDKHLLNVFWCAFKCVRVCVCVCARVTVSLQIHCSHQIKMELTKWNEGELFQACILLKKTHFMENSNHIKSMPHTHGIMPNKLMSTRFKKNSTSF